MKPSVAARNPQITFMFLRLQQKRTSLKFLDFFKWSVALLPYAESFRQSQVNEHQLLRCIALTRNLFMLAGKPKSSNPRVVIWPPLFTHWIFCVALRCASRIPYLKSKHVVTKCIHFGGISSECGIHNLKWENSWCIINTVFSSIYIYVCAAAFFSTLTENKLDLFTKNQHCLEHFAMETIC